MNAMAAALAEAGFRVARFEFAYMAARREGSRKPPPKAEFLCGEYLAAIDALALPGPLFIGGKSMGGRVASLVADRLHGEARIAGLICLGYPFHPPGKPQQLRTAHLEDLATPCLICQGTRDPFGTREEVAAYDLSPQVELFWLEDGDHDLKPRRKVTGLSHDDHLRTMATPRATGRNGSSPGTKADLARNLARVQPVARRHGRSRRCRVAAIGADRVGQEPQPVEHHQHRAAFMADHRQRQRQVEEQARPSPAGASRRWRRRGSGG
jgi:uncharacterized protein